MPIASGVVVPVDMALKQQLADDLGQRTEVEISGVGPLGIAVVLETASMDAMTSLTGQIAGRHDVMDLQMTYCNWEDQP